MAHPSMRKLRKLVRSPGVFLRDLLEARYPHVANELGIAETLEPALIASEQVLEAGVDVPFPIDVVYTWVDGADPAWRARFDAHAPHTQAEPAGTGSGRDEARFQSHDELGWSVRSVLAFLPWVRRIHVITDAQQPRELPADDRIRVVDHREIIDGRWLPTFNSHVIEAHLHHVPGLAEHFVYFNDDVLVARALRPAHFFQPNGLASHFVSAKSLSAMQAAGRHTPTLAAASNSRELLRAQYGVDVDTPLVHTYLPLQRAAFERVWERHGSRIESFLGNRTRGGDDLNLASFLVPWTAYLDGRASVKADVCHYFNVRSPSAPARYRSLARRHAAGIPPHSMCLNDFAADAQASPAYAQQLQQFLHTYFDAAPARPAPPVPALAVPPCHDR